MGWRAIKTFGILYGTLTTLFSAPRAREVRPATVKSGGDDRVTEAAFARIQIRPFAGRLAAARIFDSRPVRFGLFEPGKSPRFPARAAPAGTDLKVLLLEDNLLWSSRVSKTLRSLGHEVAEVNSQI